MISIAQIEQAVREVLEEEANPLARETGFIQRERNFSGAEFAQLLIFGWLQNGQASLEELSQVAQEVEVTLSAPALSQRFTRQCADFMRRLFERLAQKRMRAEAVEIPLLRRFTAVVIEDSSSITLPAQLADVWRGCGGRGKSSKAALKLHTRWDVLSGELQGPLLTDGRLADARSPFKEQPLSAGSLFLADLGYFHLAWLLQQAQAGVSWLMRLKGGTVLLTKKGQHRLKLLGVLPRQVGAVIDLGVLVGVQSRIPARLIAQRVPKEVVKQRRERLEEEAKDKGQEVSQEQWELAQWTIVITNVPTHKLSVPEALILMRLRWQIELLFKLWKQKGLLDEWRSKNPWRILCELYGKLSAMLIQQWLLVLGCWHDPHRSLVKASQVVRRAGQRLLAGLTPQGDFTSVVQSIVRQMRSGCRLNTRKKRPTTSQLLLNGLDWFVLTP
ncbi:MAG TPA: IS4 family transposase [Candidatus Angelobacter sp.]|jgi:hypothetical protein|nr:IS4 family transposase [Candidatus Angelobacter sp.]